MLFKTVLFYCFFVILVNCYAFEGNSCTIESQTATCVPISQCQAAMQDIRNRRHPKLCGFDYSVPIVCCLDDVVSTAPSAFRLNVATTTAQSLDSETTKMYVPPVYDYKEVGDIDSDGCEPIPEDMTSKPTGQTAFDKCIEYQQKYVYPCEKGVALTGGLSRGNHCHHDAEELIIGGKDAAQYEFPHMVLLGFGDSLEDVEWLCGGSLISDQFVLTAAHCLGTPQLGPVSFVVVGALTRQDTQNTANIYKVKKIIKHPDYKPPSKYNDIALLELATPVKLSQYIVPACLEVGGDNDSRVLATGWGVTQYNGELSDNLEKVILQKFTNKECADHYQPQRVMKTGFDPDTQSCYGSRIASKDTCQGDSGGPIQIKSKKIDCMYVIVGVTSFGRACGFASEPAIYTRVEHYVPWIESIVWPDDS